MKAVLRATGATPARCLAAEAERLRFWAGRKAAFPAVGRISPDYYCMDGTIPRKRLGEVLKFIAAMEKKYGLRCANVFHAGDGNLHPLILFDANDPDSAACAPSSSAPRSSKMCDRGRRHHHRRARRRRREDQPDVRAVRPGRSWSRSSRSSAPSTRPACSIPARRCPTLHRCAEFGACTCTRGAAAVSRTAAVLTMDPTLQALQERVRAAAASAGRRCVIRGGGTKDFYGNEPRGEILDMRGVTRHRRLRADRARRHRARRHAARGGRGDARGAEPDARRSSRRTSAPARPSAARSRRASPVRAAWRRARCATSCSACACSTAAATSCRSAAR